jgi:hypothetical protein
MMTGTPRQRLTVFLLPTRRGRTRLVSPELEEELAAGIEHDAGDPAADSDSDSGLRRAWRAGMRWLKARGGATERVLEELRLPEEVEVVHPAGLPGHAARRIYRRKVEESVTHHRRWLLVDGALLPLSVVLSLVPGPNLLLPYLAWRTVSHWRGQAGGARALGESELDVTFVADPELDPLLDLAEKRFVLHRKRRLREIGERVGIPDLDRHL